MKAIVSTLAALAVSVSFVGAEDAKPKAEKPKRDPAVAFGKLDADSDKALTLEEFKASPMGKKDPAKAEEVFKRKDKDGDGKLSLDEFKARPGKKKEKPES